MRLTDKDALMKTLGIKEDCEECEYANGYFCSRGSDFVNACEAICDAPTIVEFEGDINKVIVKGEEYHKIVRCKDCKHWYSDADTGMACEFTNMGQPEDGYCNWAERRSDDGM